MSFTDKVVLITGASGGIGATTAVFFAKQEAKLALVGRNEEKLKNVAEQCIHNDNTPLTIVADLNNDDDVARIVQETINKYEKIDILVNNAGMAVAGNITHCNIVNAYDQMMRTNVRAVILLTTLAAPHLVKTKGNVINISSVAGKKIRSAEYMGYNVSKAAVDHFTRGAALEMSASGVRVNSVSPGPINTGFCVTAKMPGTSDSSSELLQTVPMSPLKRLSDTEEIADLILYLASDKARGITGSDFVCDNGSLIS